MSAPLKRIAVSQRVTVDGATGERRDALDQRWPAFLKACDCLGVAMPNDPAVAVSLLTATGCQGLLLTGGNDLHGLGGGAPERDRTETCLITTALDRALPVIGVCRGMQMIQQFFDNPLETVEGHVTALQDIDIAGTRQQVNSYHQYGAVETRPPLEAWAMADDGVIKAVRHQSRCVIGIMWHPERISPFRTSDIRLFDHVFGERP